MPTQTEKDLAKQLLTPVTDDDVDALTQVLASRDTWPETLLGRALRYAAWKRNLAAVSLLLESGADVNGQDRYSGETALHKVLDRGYDGATHLPIVRALLEAGVDPNIEAVRSGTSETHPTPLHMAIAAGALETAKLLVAHKANPEQKGDGGRRAIHVAVERAVWEHKDAAPLKWLIDLGVDINASYWGGTPLCQVADWNRVDLLDVLVQAGADIEWKQGLALTKAADRGRGTEAARRLLDLGATAHSRALGAAIKNHNLEMVKLLVERGAPLDKRSTYTNNKLPLAYAREQPESNADIITYLLDNIEADIAHEQTQHYHDAQLLEVTLNPRRGRPLAHWLEQGADPNTRNEYGRAALHYVVEDGDLHDVRLLLDAGADVNAHDKFGYTPLHQAARHDNSALLRVLLDAGADPAAKLTQGRLVGWTPLHFALSYQHTANIAQLRPLSPPVGVVKPGSHALHGVFAKDKDGFTPTHNTSRIHLYTPHRCLTCHDIALYVIGAIWDGTGYDADCTVYLTCANCGTHQVWDQGLKPYTGRLPWHVLE